MPTPGRPDQLRAVHVELAGNGELHLPEPQRALPREVGVGEQHAIAVGRAVRPDGPAVGAQLRAGRRSVERGRNSGGRLRRTGRLRRAGRLRRPLVADQRATGSLHGDRAHVGVQLLGGDRSDPRLAGAPSLDPGRTDLRQPGVPAVGEPDDERPGVTLLLRPIGGGDAGDVDRLPGEVRIGVRVLGPGTEELGTTRVDLDDLIGQIARMVLEGRVTLTERHAAGVVRRHVDDPVGGPTQRRPVPAGTNRRPTGPAAPARSIAGVVAGTGKECEQRERQHTRPRPPEAVTHAPTLRASRPAVPRLFGRSTASPSRRRRRPA